MCPRKYEYAYIKKLPQPMTPESAFGVSMHSCLAKWGKKEMDQLPNRSIDQLQQSMFQKDAAKSDEVHLDIHLLLSFWHESFIHDAYESAMASEFDRKRGEVLLKKFFEWWQQEKRSVLAIEKGFSLEMDGAEIKGRFDRIELCDNGTLRIIDYKTGSEKTQTHADQDLQLSLYALAAKEMFQKELGEILFLCFSDENFSEIHTERTSSELQTASKTIALLSERIASGDYAPTPSKEKCRVCPYRRVCDVAAV